MTTLRSLAGALAPLMLLSLAHGAQAETYVVEVDLNAASTTFGGSSPLWMAAGHDNTLTMTVDSPAFEYVEPDPFCMFFGSCAYWTIARGDWTVTFDGPDAALLTSEMGALDQGWSYLFADGASGTSDAPFAIGYESGSFTLYVYLLTLGAGGSVGPGAGGNSFEMTAYSTSGTGYDLDGAGFPYLVSDATDSSYPILRDFDVDPWGGITASGPAATTFHLQEDPVIALGGTCPTSVTIDGDNFTPSGSVAIVAANGTGSVVIPSGPCAGTQMGLSSSGLKLVKMVTASALGEINYSGSVGPICSKSIQFVDMATCTPSNVDIF